MKKNRQWITITGFLLVVLLLLYWLIFSWVVPKTAGWTTPPRWRMLPLRQSKTIVHGYLGDPIPARNPKDSSYEEWTAGSKGKTYILRIDFASDTIAAGFSIRYHYENRFVERDYLIDSFSIRQ